MAATVLITGASGLLGSHVLAQWDLREYEPVVVPHRDVDLLNPGVPSTLVARYRPDVVIHLAWTASGTTQYRSSRDNDAWLASSLELRQACAQYGAWLIATGTSLEDTSAPLDAYTSAKHQLKVQLHDAIARDELTWLRPYYVIDAPRRRPALVAQTLAARDVGEAVTLREPEGLHDFVVAADVGRAILDVVRWGLRGEVPIGSGQLRRVRDVVEALGAQWVPAVDVVSEPGEGHHHEPADLSRLRGVNWSPAATAAFFAR